jgi:hypothetical protein
MTPDRPPSVCRASIEARPRATRQRWHTPRASMPRLTRGLPQLGRAAHGLIMIMISSWQVAPGSMPRCT